MISTTVPHTQIMQNPTIEPKLEPKFGCRLFAMVSPETYAGHDQFIRQCLLEGGNSLKRQSQLRFADCGDLDVTAQPDFNNLIKTLSDRYYQFGWGVASSHDQQPSMHVIKGVRPVSVDSAYDQAARGLADQKPTTIVAHLRETPHFAEREINNSHPFQVANWTLVHHGVLPGNVSRELRNQLMAARQKDPRIPSIKGTTDSEVLATYLAAELIKKTGSASTESLDTTTLKTVYKDAVSKLILWPGTLSFKDARLAVMNSGQGQLRKSPSFFIFSDNQRSLVSRYNVQNVPAGLKKLAPMLATIVPSHWNLHQFLTRLEDYIPGHIGSRTIPSGEKEYLVSSYKLQPTQNSGLNPIDWKPLPAKNSLTVLERLTENNRKTINLTQEALPQAPVFSYRDIINRMKFRLMQAVLFFQKKAHRD